MSELDEYPWQEAEGHYKKLHVSLTDLDFVEHHARYLLTHELFRGHRREAKSSIRSRRRS